jgi:hypothetical protein
MFNDFDYLEFDDQFDNDYSLPIEENKKALKAAKKDIEKVIVQDPEEEIEINNDDFAKDWIEITDDDGDDDEDDEEEC